MSAARGTVIERALALARRSPHTFTIQYPPSRHYFRGRFEAAPPLRLDRYERLLLYVHVPFCEQRCFYCNFAVDLRKSRATHERYLDALVRQLEGLEECVHARARLPGLDIGGGTPTRLEADQLERLMSALAPWRERLEPGRRISIETTPSIAARHPERLDVLRQGGVSRVSMGLQSTNDETLARVNRRRQRALGARAIENIQRAGFERISVDLVFGLPGQTPEHFHEDLERVIELEVDAITIYDCLYRGEGRVLPRLEPEWPTPAQYARMYDAAFGLLRERGYEGRYGGLNFCRRVGESGTSDYFEGRLLDGLPYVGCGNYASSLLEARWSFAPYEVDDYVEALARGEISPAQDVYDLPLEERAAKYALASLNFGVIDPARFRAAVGADLEDVFGARLEAARERGWLIERGGVFAVAPGSFEHIYALRALFYSRGAVDWLEAHAEITSSL